MLALVFDLDWAGAVAEGLDIPLLASVSAAEVDVATFEYTKPQLLSNPSAEAFVDNNVQVQAYLQMFLQQAPQQPATHQHGRAIGPITASLAFTAQLKTALRACASKTNQSTKAEASLTISPLLLLERPEYAHHVLRAVDGGLHTVPAPGRV